MKEAAGFKIGDEVEVLEDADNLPKGYVGIIQKIDEAYPDDDFEYLIEIGHPDSLVDETEIRHTRKIANKLNRKLYPNWKEKDGYLYRRF